MYRKERDAGYRAALTGAKGTVRLLIYVCVILVIILAAKTSYQFGHDVFAEEPVASRGKGKEVTVQVRSGMEAKELGELLKDNGLIDESILVFEVQYRLSGYYGGIKDGSYVLNTAQTVDEMLEILAGINTEGQPSEDKKHDNRRTNGNLHQFPGHRPHPVSGKSGADGQTGPGAGHSP